MPPIRTFGEIIDALRKEHQTRTVALAAAADHAALRAVVEAHDQGLVDYLLFGPKARILKIAKDEGLKVDEKAIREVDGEYEESAAAVAAVASGEADVLMKGSVHTGVYLKAVLDKDKGLRGPSFMSHVFIWEVLRLKRLIIVTDPGMNIAPDIEQKVAIVENAVKVAHGLGIEEPKVALLCAVENVNPKMPATVDAAAISMMWQRKQLRVKCVVDGPLALDNAVDEEAAKAKGITSPVAGKADILVAPDIEAANMLSKAYPFLVPNAALAGLAVGAKKPVVVTSRADTARSKLCSIAVAAYLSKTMA